MVDAKSLWRHSMINIGCIADICTVGRIMGSFGGTDGKVQLDKAHFHALSIASASMRIGAAILKMRGMIKNILKLVIRKGRGNPQVMTNEVNSIPVIQIRHQNMLLRN